MKVANISKFQKTSQVHLKNKKNNASKNKPWNFPGPALLNLCFFRYLACNVQQNILRSQEPEVKAWVNHARISKKSAFGISKKRKGMTIISCLNLFNQQYHWKPSKKTITYPTLRKIIDSKHAGSRLPISNVPRYSWYMKTIWTCKMFWLNVGSSNPSSWGRNVDRNDYIASRSLIPFSSNSHPIILLRLSWRITHNDHRNPFPLMYYKWAIWIFTWRIIIIFMSMNTPSPVGICGYQKIHWIHLDAK